MRIYFDNAASTPLDPQVIAAMTEVMHTHHGNPSSIHAEGRQARTLIEQSRRTVAKHLKASIGEVFFTSGGTEANNMALKNAVRDLGVRRVISSATEHHCVLHSVQALDRHTDDLEVIYLQLDGRGYPDIDQLKELLADPSKTTLVSLMHANNEIGTMIDLARVGAICQEYGAYFHSDTTQTMGYYPIDVATNYISFLTGSAHKFHGPKGVGFIYINGDNMISPYLDGGAQERNMRAGTENTYGIVGLAKALDLAYTEQDSRRAYIRHLQQYLKASIEAEFPAITFNGDPDKGHYKLLNLRLPASPQTDLLLFNMDIAGISVSGGSACSSGTDTGSHVLRAIHGDTDNAVNMRVSFSHFNTEAEIDRFLEVLRAILRKGQ
ncbi:MAG: cysteine desulfurase [Bacteroidetes bacterium]|nr:MAG: cysteine desulfurase [Bacteroidota bacterium]